MKRFTELTREEQLEILTAWLDGKVERYNHYYEKWLPELSEAFFANSRYRIKPTTLNINWSVIDKKWNFAAMDENGEIYLYELEPACDSFCWMYVDYTDSVEITNIFPDIDKDVNWETSLTERPNE